ncbi:MAG: acyltransferase [Solirubrobacteraceae bacterium]|jgi:peptidoglycan/LPS O-acetylase OafA/YrhL
MSRAEDWPRSVSDAVPRRFTAGDALRGIAALFVLVYHAAVETLIFKHSAGFVIGSDNASNFSPIFGRLAPEFIAMRFGIFIFFALSGYLLTRTFLAAYTLGTPRPAIARYARNRALRIIPAFWVVTTVFVLWNHVAGSAGIGGLLATYGFAQNYHWSAAADVMRQAWTLDIEVAFYILIPLASLTALAAGRQMQRTPQRRLAILLSVLLAAYILSLLAKHDAGNPINNNYNLGEFLFAFIPGVVLAAVEPFAAPRVRGSGHGGALAWGVLGVCIALFAVFVSLSGSERGARLVFVTLACGALLAAPLILQWRTGGCWRVLDNRAMQWLGERSYGIYLIHLALMGHVLRHIASGHGITVTFVLLLIIVTPVTLLAADVLWRLIERPALQRRLPWRQAEFARPAAVKV